jgi:hypothetical protein
MHFYRFHSKEAATQNTKILFNNFDKQVTSSSSFIHNPFFFHLFAQKFLKQPEIKLSVEIENKIKKN